MGCPSTSRRRAPACIPSVLDGWWIEGCVEGVTGWAIGMRNHLIHGANSESLYEKLEQIVVPLYYQDRQGFINVMRHAIALNGSVFNTQRMLKEYMIKVYQVPPIWSATVGTPKRDQHAHKVEF